MEVIKLRSINKTKKDKSILLSDVVMTILSDKNLKINSGHGIINRGEFTNIRMMTKSDHILVFLTR